MNDRISLAPWRSLLSRALQRNRSHPHARYLQLATLQPNGRPANRTVVFRGFLDDSNQLKFVTDLRSQKAIEITQNPWAEACWYFTETREQFRLAGTLTLVSGEMDEKWQLARQQAWRELSDAARIQFAWPASGQPRAEREAFDPPTPDPLQPLPHFCLLLLNPVQVDHLELRGDPQNRSIYNLQDETWTMQPVNP